MTKIPIVPDYNLIAAEFALGRVLAVTPLAGGAPDVAKLTATYGVFVVKPGHDRTSAELYARVASVLNTAAIGYAGAARAVGACFATSCGFQSFKTDKLGRRMTATRSKSVPAGAATQSR